MSKLVAYQEAVEQAFRGFLLDGPDGVLQVDTSASEVTIEDIEKYSRQAPCVILAPLGGKHRRAGATVFNDQMYSASILTKARAAADRLKMAQAIKEMILIELPFIKLPCATAPTNIEDFNLTGDLHDEMALCLWVIRWSQEVTLSQYDISSLDDFLRLHVDYHLDELGDEPDSEQMIELPGPVP